ncbi:MAG: bifunctional glutamate N-acetyltransferase/amino-acid acetyltransferase ArgJ [Elusimicrobiota bacterium]|jgi:glutamate N-acetyltransferase/amino-acid N-acetyltransferase
MNTLPKGYRAAGLPRHDRPRPSRHGLAIFYSEHPAAAAACFTTNIVKSAHITVDQKNLRRGRAQAILVNSGCANCCTGPRGIRDAEKTIGWAADALGITSRDVLTASTGVIGDFMPMDLLSEEIPMIAKKLLGADGLQAQSFHKAAQAIMTTDTKIKMAHAAFTAGGREVRLWGCAKGAGMIHPAMTRTGLPKSLKGKHATMLAFLLTDLETKPADLTALLEPAVEKSFNRVTVDGDTSTNDSAFLLANGCSKVSLASPGVKTQFQAALNQLCMDLAKQMAKDGEGASKFLEIRVEGARTEAEAQQMAMTVATSPLVKTAAYGEDSNWGRILAAMGRSGVRFDPAQAEIGFGPLCVFRQGAPTAVSAEAAREPLRAKEVTIFIRLHQGKAQGVYWTCDFTGQYVDINARYRS